MRASMPVAAAGWPVGRSARVRKLRALKLNNVTTRVITTSAFSAAATANVA